VFVVASAVRFLLSELIQIPRLDGVSSHDGDIQDDVAFSEIIDTQVRDSVQHHAIPRSVDTFEAQLNTIRRV
jgi:hypothetical protein